MNIGIVDLQTAVNLLTKETAFNNKIPHGVLKDFLHLEDWPRNNNVYWGYGHKESEVDAFKFLNDHFIVEQLFAAGFDYPIQIFAKDGAFYAKLCHDEDVKLDYLIALSPKKHVGFEPVLVEFVAH